MYDHYWTTPRLQPGAQIQQPLQRAQQALRDIRGRGVTQYVDLTKSNKRRREEVDTEDEGEEIEDKTSALHQLKLIPGKSPLMVRDGSRSSEFLGKRFTAQRHRRWLPSTCSQLRELRNEVT